MLDVPEELLVERVTGRRTDPITGKIYHLRFSPPENEEVAERLIQRNDDTAEKIIIRYREFHSHIDEIKSCYEDKTVHINGALDAKEVSVTITAQLDEAILRKRKHIYDPDEYEHSDQEKNNGSLKAIKSHLYIQEASIIDIESLHHEVEI